VNFHQNLKPNGNLEPSPIVGRLILRPTITANYISPRDNNKHDQEITTRSAPFILPTTSLAIAVGSGEALSRRYKERHHLLAHTRQSTMAGKVYDASLGADVWAHTPSTDSILVRHMTTPILLYWKPAPRMHIQETCPHRCSCQPSCCTNPFITNHTAKTNAVRPKPSASAITYPPRRLSNLLLAVSSQTRRVQTATPQQNYPW
jgi:hypothetical protein